MGHGPENPDSRDPRLSEAGHPVLRISTLLARADVFQLAIERLADLVAPHRPDRLVRGRVARLHLRRPPGAAPRSGLCHGPQARQAARFGGRPRLPPQYGSDTIEISADLVPARSRVVIVDDLIATGGTAAATAELLAKIDVEVAAAAFLIELTGLNGRRRLRAPVVRPARLRRLSPPAVPQGTNCSLRIRSSMLCSGSNSRVSVMPRSSHTRPPPRPGSRCSRRPR